MNSTDLEKLIPTLDQILKDPKGTVVPESSSLLFAVTNFLSFKMDTDNCEQLMDYVHRLPIEFQVLLLRGAIRTTPEVRAHERVTQWIHDTPTLIFHSPEN